jgi:hypothetical protein
MHYTNKCTNYIAYYITLRDYKAAKFPSSTKTYVKVAGLDNTIYTN